MFRRLTLWLLLVGMLGGCQKRETSSTAGDEAVRRWRSRRLHSQEYRQPVL